MTGNLDFRLALRNLLRNRRRSITTLLALIVGVCAILLFGGYSKDITYGLQTDFVQRTGHLQIQKKGYFLRGSGNSAAFGIPDYDALIARVKQDPQLAPMLVVVTPTLQLGGIAGNFPAGVSRTVMVQGMHADDQSRMRLWNDYGFPSDPKPVALAGTPENAIVVGQGVARVLHLCEALKVPDCNDNEDADPAAAASAPGGETPDDITALTQLEKPATPAASGTQIEILAANTHGAPNVGSFAVAKAEMQGVKELDDIYVAMHLPRAQRLVYGSEKPQVTAIMIQLQHTDQLPEAQERLRAVLSAAPGGDRLEILDFATLNPFYEQTNRMFSAIFGFVFALIGIIVLFIVSNTMSMTIVERTIEIGTLRAIGTRRSGIQGLFLCEGFLLGLAGAAMGVVVALVVGWIVNRSGLTWMPPARVDAVPLTVRVWGEWAQIAGAFAGLALVAAFSAWLPARRAARMQIVDALRHA